MAIEMRRCANCNVYGDAKRPSCSFCGTLAQAERPVQATRDAGLGGLDGVAGDKFRSDFVTVLGAVVGPAKAEGLITGMEDFIQSRAEAGAKSAILKFGIAVGVAAIVVPMIVKKMSK